MFPPGAVQPPKRGKVAPGGIIYLDPNRVKADDGWALLIHEVIHQFGAGFGDPEIMGRLEAKYSDDPAHGGIDQARGSNEITRKIAETCK